MVKQKSWVQHASISKFERQEKSKWGKDKHHYMPMEEKIKLSMDGGKRVSGLRGNQELQLLCSKWEKN